MNEYRSNKGVGVYEDETPGHIMVARQMASEIIKNENHEMQNEILKEIRQIVLEERRKLIDMNIQQVEYLKKTLENI